MKRTILHPGFLYINRRAFTLVELLIVITILGILSAIAIPLFLGQRTRAIHTEAKTNLEALKLLEERYFSENGTYTPSLGTCSKDNPGNVATIQTLLPGFLPGSDLKFSYCIQANIDIDGNAQTPCFRASAFGNSNTPVNGTAFRIDCNNNKNF